MALIILLLASSATAEATTYFYKNGLVVKASTFKSASKLCYTTLTGGKYPGEERGLDIIDMCVNPVKEIK